MSDYNIYLFPSSDEEVRQGDIFRWERSAPSDHRFGFVLTADCDFAQKKTRDQVTYLPIIRAEEYIETVWCPIQIAKRRNRAIGEATRIINKANILRKTDGVALTAEIVTDWIDRDPAKTILERLELTGTSQGAKLASLCEAISHCTAAGSASNDFQGSNRELLATLMATIGGESNAKTLTKVSLDAASILSKPPDDAFFLNELPEGLPEGFVVMLPHVRTIQESSLMCAPQDLLLSNRQSAALRIGRLQDRIRFAIAQEFGQLFTRIGLPSHYEERRSKIIRSVTGGDSDD